MAGSDGSVLKHLSRLRLVSVVVLDNAALADGLVSALVAGGDERLLEERDGILAGQSRSPRRESAVSNTHACDLDSTAPMKTVERQDGGR